MPLVLALVGSLKARPAAKSSPATTPSGCHSIGSDREHTEAPVKHIAR